MGVGEYICYCFKNKHLVSVEVAINYANRRRP